MVAGGWVLGSAERYDRERAIYPEDCLAFVKQTQPKMWEKYRKLYPSDPDGAFLAKLTAQLSKADPNATDKHLRTFGTLGVLCHELRDRSCSFKLCQFKPDHTLNPETLAAYRQNILRLVPELPTTNGSDCCGWLCFLTHARVCTTSPFIHTAR